MVSFGDEGARVIDTFNEENFNFQKFKLEMRLASVDLWGIVKETPLSNIDMKVKKKYQSCIQKAMSIIALNFPSHFQSYHLPCAI